MGENKEPKFINEKIVGRNLTWRRILKFVLISLLCGAVFGAAAFSVFWFARSRAELLEEDRLPAETAAGTAAEAEASVTVTVPEETQVTVSVQVESKAEETGPEKETGEAAVVSSENSETEQKPSEEEQTEPFGEDEVMMLIDKSREEYEYSLDDFRELSSKQQAAVEEMAVHFVTVECVISETTWFESTVETKRLYSGVILSASEDEILILTVPAAALDDAVINVRFSDGTRQNAMVKKYSPRDGLTVLAVPCEGLGKDFLEKVSPVEYAVPSSIVPGTQLIAAGAPLGVVGSFDFGCIGYISDPVSTVDGSITYCLADIDSDIETGTFFTDLEGKLIGIGMKCPSGSECSGILMVNSIEYIIESLKKGREMAYLGISGMDTSFEMKYKNIPEGMYVTELDEDCPAYEGGIKQGDILILAGNREIKGTEDYKNFMRNLRPEETTAMTIMRTGAAGEYKKLELTLTAGTR